MYINIQSIGIIFGWYNFSEEAIGLHFNALKTYSVILMSYAIALHYRKVETSHTHYYIDQSQRVKYLYPSLK